MRRFTTVMEVKRRIDAQGPVSKVTHLIHEAVFVQQPAFHCDLCFETGIVS